VKVIPNCPLLRNTSNHLARLNSVLVLVDGVVPLPQFLFGVSVAAVYGLTQATHTPFGIFFSLLTVCSLRGAWLYYLELKSQREESPVSISRPAVA